jgi:hypothetical protein
MKKSKQIQLVLITAVLASCNKPNKDWEGSTNHTYIRSYSTAPYSRTRHFGAGNALLWYYAFRPYGNYNNGSYQRAGYYSSGISERSNIGNNFGKTSIVRGGFGRGGYSVSS